MRDVTVVLNRSGGKKAHYKTPKKQHQPRVPPAFHFKLSYYIRHRKLKDAAAGGFETVVGRNKHLDSLKITLVVFVMANLVFMNTFLTF